MEKGRSLVTNIDRKGKWRPDTGAVSYTHLPLHLPPINVIVSDDPENSNLVAGFVLRCFQHLSNPDLDTRQCTWRHNR